MLAFKCGAFLLGAFGLAYIVGHSSISRPVRVLLGGVPAAPELGRAAVPGMFGPVGEWFCELLECPACFGFWTGLVGGFTVLRADDLSAPAQFGWCVWVGCVTTGFNFILGRLTRLI